MNMRVVAIGNHPLFAVAVTLLGVIAGLVGSLYTEQIKRSFPFHLSWPVSADPQAILFWLIISSFALMFFGRQWASDKSVLKAQRELIEQSASLQALIKTLPPEGFLSWWSSRYCACRKVARKVLNTKEITIDQIEEAIRQVLQHVVFLGVEFDGVPADCRYAANIMLYCNREGMKDDEMNRIGGILKFFDRDYSALQGYLELLPKLSVASDTEKHAQDEHLEAFALPVDKLEVSEHGKIRQLPGAPLTFWQNGPSHFADASQLAEWCMKHGDFSDSVEQAINAYFKSERAQRIKSFASIPIPNPKSVDDGKVSQPMAVLNIHRDRMDMLRGADAFKLFFPLAAPFTALIGELLVARQNLAKSATITMV